MQEAYGTYGKCQPHPLELVLLSLIGFMQRLFNMPQATLHAEILKDNRPICEKLGRWCPVGNINFSMASPFLGGRTWVLYALGSQQAMLVSK